MIDDTSLTQAVWMEWKIAARLYRAYLRSLQRAARSGDAFQYRAAHMQAMKECDDEALVAIAEGRRLEDIMDLGKDVLDEYYEANTPHRAADVLTLMGMLPVLTTVDGVRAHRWHHISTIVERRIP